MEIIFKPKALDDTEFFKKSGNKSLQLKITKLLEELAIHPETGSGKVEKLKGNLTGYFSRRINIEHRIVYTIDYYSDKVEIYSMRGHYEK
jgi:toxin YoeB